MRLVPPVTRTREVPGGRRSTGGTSGLSLGRPFRAGSQDVFPSLSRNLFVYDYPESFTFCSLGKRPFSWFSPRPPSVPPRPGRTPEVTSTRFVVRLLGRNRGHAHLWVYTFDVLRVFPPAQTSTLHLVLYRTHSSAPLSKCPSGRRGEEGLTGQTDPRALGCRSSTSTRGTPFPPTCSSGAYPGP